MLARLILFVLKQPLKESHDNTAVLHASLSMSMLVTWLTKILWENPHLTMERIKTWNGCCCQTINDTRMKHRACVWGLHHGCNCIEVRKSKSQDYKPVHSHWWGRCSPSIRILQGTASHWDQQDTGFVLLKNKPALAKGTVHIINSLRSLVPFLQY